MARLRPTRAVRALTFEEKTRVANFFMLLIEIDMQKGVTRKRRSPRKASAKKESHETEQKARDKKDPTKLIKRSRILCFKAFEICYTLLFFEHDHRCLAKQGGDMCKCGHS